MFETTVTVTGWVGSDVTLIQTRNGGHLATFRVGSTPRRLRDGEWVDLPTIWFPVKCWGALAEHVARSVRQRDPVLLQGRLVEETWEREDGGQARRHVVVASSVGHDLTHGEATFTRSKPSEPPAPTSQVAA